MEANWWSICISPRNAENVAFRVLQERLDEISKHLLITRHEGSKGNHRHWHMLVVTEESEEFLRDLIEDHCPNEKSHHLVMIKRLPTEEDVVRYIVYMAHEAWTESIFELYSFTTFAFNTVKMEARLMKQAWLYYAKKNIWKLDANERRIVADELL